MSTVLARAEHSAEMVDRLAFSEEQERLIREMYAPGASDLEFSVLLETAKALGLNPLKKQIHFVNRYDNQKERNVWSCQTGIDGFRSIADDTGKYDGQDAPEFEYNDRGHLLLARVRVYRKDIGRPFVGEARWEEFAQTKRDGSPTHMWKKMSHTMLAKCAEAQALRRAFPQKLGGLYSDDEMAQAENDRNACPPHPAPPITVPRSELEPARHAPPIADAEFEAAKPAAPPATPAIDPAAKALVDDLVRRASTAEAKDLEDLIDEARRLPVQAKRGLGAVVMRRFALTDDLDEIDSVIAWGTGHGVEVAWLTQRAMKRCAEIKADIAQLKAIDTAQV